MDIRRSINTRVWADDWFEGLKPFEKLLWFYLLTNAQTNMLGIYELSVKRISFETGLKPAEINNTFKAFERVKKAFYWFGWIVLPNWMKNQSLNTNMLTSASRLFELLPNELKIKLSENNFKDFESLLKGCQTLPKIEKEKEIEKESLNGKFDLLIDGGWNEDLETYKGIQANYPKIFKMKRPLLFKEHERLVKKWGASSVKEIYRDMEAWSKLSTKDWAAGVADKWCATAKEKREGKK